MRLRITHCHNTIKALTTTLEDLAVKLDSKLSREHLRALKDTVQQSTKTASEKVSQTHTRKLNQLTSNKKPSPPTADKEKWVVNVSQRTLNPVEISALEKGSNFSIAPKKIPVAKILSSVENGIFSLNQTAKDTIRVSVANILKSCKVPATVNITKEQEKALQNLRRDETVKILPADKGRSIVVMDSDEYKEKVYVLLNDTNTYWKLTDKRLNPTTSVEKDLNKILLNIKNERNGTTSQIGPNLYRKLHCSNSTPASFYGLPKIHKPGRPLRPITSSIGSPTYAASKYLVSVLSPLRKNTFTVQNSSVFTQQIKHHSITSEEVMVSFDMKSLFTSIPVDLALRITKERLQQDQNLAELRTNLSVDNILKLSDFVLNHNYFKYDDDHYKQIFGCAMGSPISPVLADLVMEEIEATAISTFSHPPKWWFRYVDDSHSCLRKDQVNEFHKHLNSINPNIQFTLELENTNGQGLPFLDTITTRRGTAIQVDVYRKPYTHRPLS